MSPKQLTAVLISTLLLATIPVSAQQHSAAKAEISCIKCHSKLMRRESQPAKMYDQDVHFSAGVICSDCHGGDPTNPNFHGRKEDNPIFNGKPTPAEIPALCAKCHGDPTYMRGHNPSLPVDQLEKYVTSLHGQRLLKEGDTKAAQCVSCHSVHDIRKVGEPASPVYPLNLPQTCSRCHSDKEYMAEYGIPTNQYELYATSVHGVPLLERGDVAAPACNDCHSNHGAFPPEVEDITAVCGMCHVNNQKLYRQSFHSDIFAMLESPGCVTCHSNHGIQPPSEEMLGAGDRSACGACHAQEADDPGFKVSLAMKSTLDSLTSQIHFAALMIEQAEQKGMEASDLSFQLRDIRQSYIQARTQVHTFSDSAVAATALPGLELAASTSEDARVLLDEHKGRRWWLAGATLILLIVIGALFLKLRQVESE